MTRPTRAAALALAAALLAGCATTTAYAPSTGGPVLAGPPAIATAETAPFAVILGAAPGGVVPIGTEVSLSLTSARDGFASVYALSPDGRVSALAENRRVAAGRALALPGEETWRLRARAPADREHLLAVVALDPIPEAVAALLKAAPGPGLKYRAALDRLLKSQL